MLEFATELKATLIEELSESREISKRISEKSPAWPHIDAVIRVYERLVVILDKFIKEGAVDMEKLKAEIKIIRTERIEDIVSSERGGWIEPMILKIATSIEPGYRGEVEPGTISWAHFSGRVYDMKKRNPPALAAEYWPKTKGGKMYLYRFNEAQQRAYEEKKSRMQKRRSITPMGRG